MGGRNAAARGEEAVELLREDGPIGDVVDLHVREFHETDVQKAAPPGHDVLEGAALERVLLGQDIDPLDPARFPDADLGARPDELEGGEVGASEPQVLGMSGYFARALSATSPSFFLIFF